MKLWTYFSLVSLLLASVLWALSLLQAQSYWLMRCFYTVNLLIGFPLAIVALLMTIVTVALPLLSKARWQHMVGWSALWLLTFLLAGFVCLTSVFTGYDNITSAAFVDRHYYLVRIDQLDAYRYRLYDCGDRLGIVCRASEVEIGLGFLLQPNAIRLEYDAATRMVSVSAGNRIIKPD